MTRRPPRAALVLIAALAACQSIPPPVAVPSVQATASPSPTAPLVSIQPGGTLRIGLAADVGLLDPGHDDDAARPVTRQIYEGLVANALDGAVGVLATKWSVSPDGRTWTFTLRDGVIFHDGTAFDATAAMKSLMRAPNDPIVEGASAPDATTLGVTTRVPFGPFLSALSTPAYAIVRTGATNVGTGPFRIAPGTETARPLLLERNPRYWRKDRNGQALPYLDRLTFAAYSDAPSRVAALRSGSVDLVPEIGVADVPAVRADPSLQLLSRTASTTLFVGLNLSVPPLDDLRVRRAIAQALNPRALVERLFNGEAKLASQFPPPRTLGYDDSVTEFAKNDPDAAKKLLADAGKATFDLDVWYVLGAPPSRPDDRRIAESIAADLAAVGIVANLKTIDFVTFTLSVRDNKYPLWIDTLVDRRGDADEVLGRSFIPPVLNGQDLPTIGGAWVNAESAGLLRKARSEPDPSKRAELYKQVSKIAQREVPRIPLVWSAPSAAATKKVQNAQGDLFTEVGIGK
ncbi:MAG TPA: ABC transporter substrate-binding protein [Candidatus Limnocylindria bacterium]|nr:ABC transporter substrate-binding protein [Candidatus Limnocylindria bacterium]